jgi:hypothetical protein
VSPEPLVAGKMNCRGLAREGRARGSGAYRGPLLFGGPADLVGPVALRRRLAPGLPLSTSGCPIERYVSK